MSQARKRKDYSLERIDALLAGRRRWILLFLIVVFVLKLIYVISSSGSLEVMVPILDAEYYDNMGKSIAAGHVVQSEAFFMGPLYPYLLGLIYGMLGRNVMLVRVIQILGGTATVALTYFVGKRAFRPSVALLGAGMVALYGTITFYEGQLLMEWLVMLLNMSLLLVLYQDFKRRLLLKYSLAGFLLGLSSLARASILILAPVALTWVLFVSQEKRRAVSAVVFLTSVLLTIAPATLHNYVASKDFIPLTWNGGVNFFIGNSEEASGAYMAPVGVDFYSDWTTRRYVEKLMGPGLKPSEISGYWSHQVATFVKQHPGKELVLLLRKTALFFNALEIPQTESQDLAKCRYAALRVLFVNFWMLCTLGLVGMACTLRDWRRRFLLHGFIIACSVAAIAFFITSRYRIEIAPALALFASFTLLEILPGAFARLGRGFLAILLFGILLFATRPGLFPVDREYSRWREDIHEGRRWCAAGDERKAIEAIDTAVGLRPDDPESYIHRAIIYDTFGMLPQAVEDYHHSLAINPAMPAVHYDLAQILRRARQYPAAVEEYQKALGLDSLMVEASNNLGVTYQLMEDHDQAIACFRRAVRIDPGHLRAYNNLGAALAESGNVDEAILWFKRAIERDPGYANSYKNLAMAYMTARRLPDAKMNLEHYIKLKPDDAGAVSMLRAVSAAIDSSEAVPRSK